MGLSFAAPLLLLGLLAVVGPIVAHFTGKQEIRRVRLPTWRFLSVTSQTVRRRGRIEHLTLLLLRALAVVAVALLLARPDFTWRAQAPPGVDPTLPLVLALDRSASTSIAAGGRAVWQVEVEEARTALRALEPGTLAAIVLWDGSAEVLGPGLTADHAALLSLLDAAAPGHGASDLDAALRASRDLLLEGAVAGARILVLTDGSATREPRNVADWPPGFQVHVRALLEGPAANRWIDGGTVQAPQRKGEGPRVEARVRGVGDLRDGVVPVTLDLGLGVDVVGDVALEGGVGTRSFTLPSGQASSAGGSLALPADAMPADDRLPVSIVGEREVSVLLVSGDGGSHPREDEVAYLERALAPAAGLSRVRTRRVAAEELRRLDGGAGDVVVLANVADPGPLAADLAAFVARGGGLLIGVGHQVEPARYQESLGALLPAAMTEVKVRGASTFEVTPTGLLSPSLEREEFRVFRTGGLATFAKVRFGRTMGVSPQLPEGTDVLLRFSDGLPALLGRRVGEGRVLLLLTSLDDDWTDLPLRSIWVPMVHQLVRALSHSLDSEAGPVVEVGASVAVPVPPDGEVWVRSPDGGVHPVDTALVDADGGVPFLGTSLPGAYEVRWSAPGQGESASVVRRRFFVRVPAAESALRPLDSEALLRAVPGLRWQGAGQEGVAAPVEISRTSPLAPWLLVLVVMALLGEAVVLSREAA